MINRYVVMLAGLAALAVATPSFALEGCTCAGMALNGAKVLGTVDAASGAVTLDGAKAQAGMVLKNGSTIAIGKEGSASLSVSGCSVPMTAASSVSVSQTGPDVCVKLVENGKLVTAEQFAGALPGEQQGATTQAEVGYRISSVRAILQNLTPEQRVLGTVVVIGGTAWAVSELVNEASTVAECVSQCG